MKNIIVMILLFFSFIAISCKKDDKKYNLPIEREKLKSILLDIYLAGAATEMDSSVNKDSLKKIYLTEICMIHKVTQQELKTALDKLNESHMVNADIQREILDSINNLNLNPPKDRPY